MELTPGSETSTHLIQTPGLYPKENTLHQQHGESLKTKILLMLQELCEFIRLRSSGTQTNPLFNEYEGLFP
jgi:hypothetical protein